MELKRYSFPFGVLDDDGNEQHQRLATDQDLDDVLEGEMSPSEHLHLLAKREMDQFPEMDYRKAVKRVMDRNPTVVRLYASESAGCLRVV